MGDCGRIAKEQSEHCLLLHPDLSSRGQCLPAFCGQGIPGNGSGGRLQSVERLRSGYRTRAGESAEEVTTKPRITSKTVATVAHRRGCEIRVDAHRNAGVALCPFTFAMRDSPRGE